MAHTSQKQSQHRSPSELVQQRMDALGLVDISKPDISKSDLELPARGITEAPTHVLGKLYSRYGAVVAYIGTVYSNLEVERLISEHRYAAKRAEILTRAAPDDRRISVAEKKALADAHPDVIALQEEMTIATAMSKKAALLLESHRTIWQSLSREISRRQETELGHSGSSRNDGSFDVGSRNGGTPRHGESFRRRARR